MYTSLTASEPLLNTYISNHGTVTVVSRRHQRRIISITTHLESFVSFILSMLYILPAD